MSLFSETLVMLRKNAGFHTAYRFYHANGGRPVLEISYRKYLLTEQGANLPAIRRLEKLFFALRLVPGSFEANALTIAWLKTLAGESFFSNILAPLICPDAEKSSLSPLHKAVKRALTGTKYQMTPDQLRAILANRDRYLCYLALSKDDGVWSVETVAKTFGIRKKSAEAALRALQGVKILKKAASGRYTCPLSSRMIEFPHLNTVEKTLWVKLRSYHQDLVAGGEGYWQRGCIVRADSQAFRNFFPLMGLNIATAQTYSITTKTPGSALFLVEGKVVKLCDF